MKYARTRKSIDSLRGTEIEIAKRRRGILDIAGKKIAITYPPGHSALIRAPAKMSPFGRSLVPSGREMVSRKSRGVFPAPCRIAQSAFIVGASTVTSIDMEKKKSIRGYY